MLWRGTHAADASRVPWAPKSIKKTASSFRGNWGIPYLRLTQYAVENYEIDFSFFHLKTLQDNEKSFLPNFK